MSFQVFLRVLSFVAVLETCHGDQVALPVGNDLLLGQTYFNFSAGVLRTLESAEGESQAPKSGPAAVPFTSSGGADADSIFGLASILAIANEKTWPLSVPIFDKYLETAPKNVPASFAYVVNELTKDTDIQISNAIFTSDKVELSPGLKELKVELVNTDLKSKDAVSTINANLAKKIVTPLEDGYIPKDETLSPAAKALLVNTLHFTGTWPTSAKKLPNAKFNDVDDVEMFEVAGKFQVFESKQGVEVILPFKNERRGLSLVLPNNLAEALKSETVDEPKLLNVSSVRIQLPVFSATLRVLENSGYTKCDFKKAENFLQLLDEVTFVSFSADKLEALSVTGAQVNNANLFKQELAKSSGRAISQTSDGGNAVDPAPATKGADTAPAAPSAASDSLAEKLIVFRKPFTWTVLDANLGPLFTGSILSLDFLKKDSLDTTDIATPNGRVFGLREEVSYAKCL